MAGFPSSVSSRVRGAADAIRCRLQVSLLTVGPIAVLAALAGGFIVISLQGAVGAVERVGDPFRRWLTTSALLVPVYLLAVLGAVALARWWFAGTRFRRLLTATALATMIAATSLAGVLTVAASAAYDYRFQSARMERTAATADQLTADQLTGGKLTAGSPSVAAPQPASSVAVSVCTVCESRRKTLEAHVRAGTLASIITLVTNAVLVMWVVALRGGQLWIDGPRRAAPSPPVSPDPELAVA